MAQNSMVIIARLLVTAAIPLMITTACSSHHDEPAPSSDSVTPGITFSSTIDLSTERSRDPRHPWRINGKNGRNGRPGQNGEDGENGQNGGNGGNGGDGGAGADGGDGGDGGNG